MFELSFGSATLAVAVSLFTAVAAVWDLRTKRIPNKLTLPMFFAGWIYQGIDRGWTGLGDAALGFLVGFGILFVLWIVGGGGGGDVKLMGALSVWLGFRLTLLVLILSTFIVLLATVGVIVWSLSTRGLRRSKSHYLATGKDQPRKSKSGKTAPVRKETVAEKQSRRVMPYAVPVALATWAVLLWKLPTLDNPVRGTSPVPAVQNTAP